VLYTEQARELAQSGGIDDVALEEMSEAEKQAELAKREAEKASQAFQKWVRIFLFMAHVGKILENLSSISNRFKPCVAEAVRRCSLHAEGPVQRKEFFGVFQNCSNGVTFLEVSRGAFRHCTP